MNHVTECSKTIQEHEKKALSIWGSMDASEKQGVRFGLFPHNKLQQATDEGYNNHNLCVGLMEIANRDGGMRG